MRSFVRHMQGVLTRILPHPGNRNVAVPGLIGGKGLAPPTTRFDLTKFPLDPRINFTRNSGGTYWGADGNLLIASVNEPRPYRNRFDPQIKGILIEESSTNLFINSLVDGTNLATQSITPLAASHTLSFWGTGSVAISGGHVATINGAGDDVRREYQFTPTAVSTTFTVTGRVYWAQVEQKTFATSFIPTSATAATRQYDVPVVQGANFTDWYNSIEGTVVAKFMAPFISGYNAGVWMFDDTAGTGTEKQYNYGGVANSFNANVSQATLNVQTGMTEGIPHITAFGYKVNDFALSRDGQTPVVDISGLVPVPGVNNRMFIGPERYGVRVINGYVASIDYWNTRLPDEIIKGLSAR
jgi:hypothetical protein